METVEYKVGDLVALNSSPEVAFTISSVDWKTVKKVKSQLLGLVGVSGYDKMPGSYYCGDGMPAACVHPFVAKKSKTAELAELLHNKFAPYSEEKLVGLSESDKDKVMGNATILINTASALGMTLEELNRRLKLNLPLIDQ